MHSLCPCPPLNNVDEGPFSGFVMCQLEEAVQFPGLLSVCLSSGWVTREILVWHVVGRRQQQPLCISYLCCWSVDSHSWWNVYVYNYNVYNFFSSGLLFCLIPIWFLYLFQAFLQRYPLLLIVCHYPDFFHVLIRKHHRAHQPVSHWATSFHMI